MKTRYEFKFIIDYDQYYFMKNRISFMMQPDVHGEQYPVFSQYYDSHDLKFLSQKVEGETEHIKIRSRCYNFDFNKGPHTLEAKIKNGVAQVKIREHMDELDLNKKNYFKTLNLSMNLRPVCNIFYIREAFEMNNDGKHLRVTFDSHLVKLHHTEKIISKKELFKRKIQDKIILEVKCDSFNLPDFIHTELKLIGANYDTFSKYENVLKTLQGNEYL